MKKTFVELVKDYSNWKLQEKGNGKLTRNELTALRETFKKRAAKTTQPKLNESKEALKETFKKQVHAYRAWKLKEKGEKGITEKELKVLKESVLRAATQKPVGNNWETYLKNYKQFKESKEPGAKITYKELKLLKENFKEASTKKIRLREADPGFNPAGAAPVAGDPNAMADPNADPALGGAPQDPLAMQGAIDQAIASLQPFSQAGANPMGADPNAGLPPVDGTQPADPAMAMQEAVKQYKAWKLKEHGTDKLTEGEVNALKESFTPKAKTKYEQIKERIAARKANLEALQENGAQDLAKKELGALGLGGKIVSNSSGKGSVEGGEELVKVPAAGSLANGYASGKAAKETKPASTWPTKAVGKEAGGALQGAGATQSKVKEAEETPAEDKPEDKLAESVKTVTDVYVDRVFEPKLDFGKLKEAMTKGLLG
jgi:hypothetical protein